MSQGTLVRFDTKRDGFFFLSHSLRTRVLLVSKNDPPAYEYFTSSLSLQSEFWELKMSSQTESWLSQGVHTISGVLETEPFQGGGGMFIRFRGSPLRFRGGSLSDFESPSVPMRDSPATPETGEDEQGGTLRSRGPAVEWKVAVMCVLRATKRSS